MALPKDYIGYLASELAKRLEKSGKVKITEMSPVTARIQQLFMDDSAREDQLNQEVREYLSQYSEQIRRDGISYQEMHQMVKRELMKKYKMIQSRGRGPDGGRLSRDKIIELSHSLVNGLASVPQVSLAVEKNEVRLEIMRQIQALIQQEDRKSTRLNSSHIQKSRMPSSA